jgi:hypothetical protein
MNKLKRFNGVGYGKQMLLDVMNEVEDGEYVRYNDILPMKDALKEVFEILSIGKNLNLNITNWYNRWKSLMPIVHQ